MRSSGKLILAATLCLCACGGDDESKPATPTDPSCPPRSRIVGEACIEPGVQDDGCPAGTLGLDDGSCRPAGIIEGECGDGFVHDGDVGCEPILPADPCPDGLMAVPGDTVCRPVMDCGSGKWGDIPIDAQTEHVDQSFVGVSDGSVTAPWTTIAEGVAAAAPGGLVAVAAGSYVEDIFFSARAVRLHGVCPSQVEMVGSATANAPIDIRTGASGSEVRGLAIRGAAFGIALSGAQQVLFDQLYVHDNARQGVHVENTLGETSCTLQRSLLERNHLLGTHIAGSEAAIVDTVVRDTLPDAQGGLGRGINIQRDGNMFVPSQATISGSLLERNHEVGLFIGSSEATIDATVVRDTLPNAQDHGRGISIELDPTASQVMIRASLVERNQRQGVFVAGSDVTIETTVVRDTLSDAQGDLGRGIHIQASRKPDVPSLASVRASLLERNHEVGLFVGGSEATIETTVVRDTLPDAEGDFGRGINVQYLERTAARSIATVRASRVERNRSAGVFVAGSDLTIDGCLMIATMPTDDGRFGDGLIAYYLSSAAYVSASASSIEQSARAGLSNFGSIVSLGSTAIRCAAFELEGEPLDGASFSFEDRGENACGCPDPDEACIAVSTGVEPPEPVAPVE